jgi:LmbE family N-acetylglucosaminyl deacetylase
MNTLAIGAHPGDVELLCAGTLALCARRGDAVSICYLTTDDKGGSDLTPEQVAAVRKGEAA